MKIHTFLHLNIDLSLDTLSAQKYKIADKNHLTVTRIIEKSKATFSGISVMRYIVLFN